MGNDKSRYDWLARLAMLYWRNQKDDDDPPSGIAAMAVVESVGGRLACPARKAANDLAGYFVPLLLTLLLTCANLRAKLITSGALLREI